MGTCITHDLIRMAVMESWVDSSCVLGVSFVKSVKLVVEEWSNVRNPSIAELQVLCFNNRDRYFFLLGHQAALCVDFSGSSHVFNFCFLTEVASRLEYGFA